MEKEMERKKNINSEGNLILKGIYIKDKKWKGKGYDTLGNIVYELKEGKGIIKEYDSFIGNLIFEGEYLNGFKNGKRKENDKSIKDELKIEGEYLNGERHGHGKEYNIIGPSYVLFEGEYLNGKRHGKGIEYYYGGNPRFEGGFLYGFKIKGKLYIQEKLEYIGEFLNGKNGMEKNMINMESKFMN